jgi:hypothetical protein
LKLAGLHRLSLGRHRFPCLAPSSSEGASWDQNGGARVRHDCTQAFSEPRARGAGPRRPQLRQARATALRWWRCEAPRVTSPIQ